LGTKPLTLTTHSSNPPIHTHHHNPTQNAGALAAFYHELVALLARFPALTTSSSSGSISYPSDDTTTSYNNPRGEEDNSTMEPPSSSSTDPFTALARALRRHWGQPPFSSFPDAVAAADTLALPTLQCAPLGIRHEERLLLALLRSHAALEAEGLAARGSAWWELTLATAYLNPPPHLLEALGGWRGVCVWVCGRVWEGIYACRRTRQTRQTLFLSSFLPTHPHTHTTGPLSLLAPSAAAHGFAGAGGLKAWIPLAYQLHEHRSRQLLHGLRATGAGGAVGAGGGEGGVGQGKKKGKGKGKWWRRDRLHRYSRAGWTFHGKGLWLLPSRPGAGHGLSLTVVRFGFLCWVMWLVGLDWYCRVGDQPKPHHTRVKPTKTNTRRAPPTTACAPSNGTLRAR
jgi:hypothetical protein